MVNISGISLARPPRFGRVAPSEPVLSLYLLATAEKILNNPRYINELPESENFKNWEKHWLRKPDSDKKIGFTQPELLKVLRMAYAIQLLQTRHTVIPRKQNGSEKMRETALFQKIQQFIGHSVKTHYAVYDALRCLQTGWRVTLFPDRPAL